MAGMDDNPYQAPREIFEVAAPERRSISQVVLSVIVATIMVAFMLAALTWLLLALYQWFAVLSF